MDGIKTVIKELKSSKAAGIAGIPAELLKNGCYKWYLLKWYLLNGIYYKWYLLNKIWKNEVIPVEWKEGIIIKVPKKENTSNCENWRGITLLCTMSKGHPPSHENRNRAGIKKKESWISTKKIMYIHHMYSKKYNRTSSAIAKDDVRESI